MLEAVTERESPSFFLAGLRRWSDSIALRFHGVKDTGGTAPLAHF
jgi:hypothetical protein